MKILGLVLRCRKHVDYDPSREGHPHDAYGNASCTACWELNSIADSGIFHGWYETLHDGTVRLVVGK